MNVVIALIFSLAFISGCVVSILSQWTGYVWIGGAVMLGLGLLTPLFVPLVFKSSLIKRWVWLVGGLIGCFASFYIQFRVPQPLPNDISKFVSKDTSTKVAIAGELLDAPMVSSSGKGKFTLLAHQITLPTGEKKLVEGKVYTTITLTQVTGLRPSQKVEIIGNLYLPSPPDNPSGFDFKAFLERSGIFAGFSGRSLKVVSEAPTFGDWWIRSRMVRAHVLGAGMPEGALLSSLVLGNRTVDLPTELKQTFIEVGLAAALAASGFQVSIILGTVLAVCGNSSHRVKFVVGTMSLWGFLILTGVSPSVLRAVVMGMGTLVGLVMGRQIRPVIGLTLAAVILLIIQPLWIWDLGFQFSFLATLGLVVSATAIAQRLEWLPPLVGTLISVPIAAYIWTLPLQLYIFGKISAYSILANVLTTPMVSVGTIVGIISGVLGVIYVPLGAVVSWLLTSPLALMIGIATWIRSLPGAVTSAGAIGLWQLLTSYGIIVLIWLQPQVRKFWLTASFVFVLILFIPGAVIRSNLYQALIISSDRTPVMLIQDRGKVALINSGDNADVNFTIIPLFQQSGINQIDWAIATGSKPNIAEGWQTIRAKPIPIKNFSTITDLDDLSSSLMGGTNSNYLKLNEPKAIAPQTQIELIGENPNLLKLQTADTTWLILTDANSDLQQQLLTDATLVPKLKAQILWWTGEELNPQLLQAINPKTAIASNRENISEQTFKQLQTANIDFYQTSRDGAIAWTHNQTPPIRALKERQDSESPI